MPMNHLPFAILGTVDGRYAQRHWTHFVAAHQSNVGSLNVDAVRHFARRDERDILDFNFAFSPLNLLAAHS